MIFFIYNRSSCAFVFNCSSNFLDAFYYFQLFVVLLLFVHPLFFRISSWFPSRYSLQSPLHFPCFPYFWQNSSFMIFHFAFFSFILGRIFVQVSIISRFFSCLFSLPIKFFPRVCSSDSSEYTSLKNLARSLKNLIFCLQRWNF